MDDRLTWKHHIFELRKNLSSATGVIYKMKTLAFPKTRSHSLYIIRYSIHTSIMVFSIWGDAEATYVNKNNVAQKNVIRIIADVDFHAHTEPLFKEHKILKLDDFYLHQYGSLMWDPDRGNLLHSALRDTSMKVSLGS